MKESEVFTTFILLLLMNIKCPHSQSNKIFGDQKLIMVLTFHQLASRESILLTFEKKIVRIKVEYFVLFLK